MQYYEKYHLMLGKQCNGTKQYNKKNPTIEISQIDYLRKHTP